MFWLNVKNELDYQGLLVKELAQKTGLNFNYLCNSMSKKTTPSVEVAYKIAQVLDVSLEYLLTGKNENHELSRDQKRWLELYDSLTDRDKKMAFAVISAMTNCQESEITPDGENYVIVK